MSVESPSPEDRFRLRPRSRGSGLAYAALWLLLVAAIAIALVQLRGGRQTEAQRLYAEGRTAFAPDSIEVLGTLDRAMRETSGLAVSVEHAGIVWSHNDSGDEARIYALDLTGLVVARFELEGVEARDWEAMDRGPCVLNPGAECLYVADTGDNVRRRDVLEIHLVPEPDPRSGRTSVVAEGSLRYLYP
ncbi:MAG: hypothetical protein HKO98_09515, partial [Gemmatimonadetes bacterium]|nr:hypothetical protein [Gemmatimonadota bacterium]